MIQLYEDYYEGKTSGGDMVTTIDRLAYTLATRRSHMSWRTFAVVQPGAIPQNRDAASVQLLQASAPVRASVDKKCMAFVFTGQGAQFAAMGLELLVYPVFQKSLAYSDAVFSGLGCEWSLIGE